MLSGSMTMHTVDLTTFGPMAKAHHQAMTILAS